MTSLGVDGAQLFYREVGQGRAVLLIHGGGATSEFWGDCLDGIGGFARAIAYDQRAFGRSRATPVVGVARHGDDAAALLRALDAGPACVLGHSFGGTIALDLAARHPALVSSLVLIEPPIDFRVVGEPEMVSMLLRLQLRRLLSGERAATRWFFNWATRYRSSGDSAFERLAPELQETGLANASSFLAIWKYSREASGAHLPRGKISSITCRATCLTGSESKRGFRRTTCRIARTLPKARLIEVGGSSHLMPFDAPQAVIEAVRESISDDGASDIREDNLVRRA